MTAAQMAGLAPIVPIHFPRVDAGVCHQVMGSQEAFFLGSPPMKRCPLTTSPTVGKGTMAGASSIALPVNGDINLWVL